MQTALFSKLLLLLGWLLATAGRPAAAQPGRLHQLDLRLRRGDQRALFELAPYLDSHRVVTRFLGHHLLRVQEAEIARELLAENCLFTKSELILDSTVSARQLEAFLLASRQHLVFSPLATAFLITPLEKRTAVVQFRAISPVRRQALEARAPTLLGEPWVRGSRVDSLVARRSPAALLRIATGLFRARERFNEYQQKDSYGDLLQLLTGTEIGVANERGELSWHPDQDFYATSQLNLLIYLATAYQQYRWSELEHRFVNSTQTVGTASREQALFDLLYSPDDSTALRAFTQLTVCPSAAVAALADEREEIDVSAHPNYALPTFPYRFLKQLPLLTEYCRAHGLDYTGSPALRQTIEQLKTDLSFAERYRLENQLISSLTLPESTALEYWTLIYEQSFLLVRSSGRILDKLYSRHWPQLLADQRQLACYLKKAALFDRLGISGSCNNYLLKFGHPSPATLAVLERYRPDDDDVRQQRQAVLTDPAATRRPAADTSLWTGIGGGAVPDLAARLRALAPQGAATEAQQRAIVELLARISYQQIGLALRLLEPIPFANARQKYSFMHSDWGFFSLGDFTQPAGRNEFLRLYTRLSEYDLYSHYLQEAGVDYRHADGTLDYDKLYELLKFDEVQALVGGGGATDKREIYALLKLLELHFHTTLGFPPKLCSSADTYHCSLYGHTDAWLAYLASHHLLRRAHDEPPSFSQE